MGLNKKGRCELGTNIHPPDCGCNVTSSLKLLSPNHDGLYPSNHEPTHKSLLQKVDFLTGYWMKRKMN